MYDTRYLVRALFRGIWEDFHWHIIGAALLGAAVAVWLWL